MDKELQRILDSVHICTECSKVFVLSEEFRYVSSLLMWIKTGECERCQST